jgi:alpha-beta hydrolase superfamily lysophospholipase
MAGEINSFKNKDAENIFYYKWHSNEKTTPVALMQIIHGMAEHAERYELFANALVKEGFVVYANDHKGHGKTAVCNERTGHFADKNGWNLVLEDIQQLKNIILSENHGLPLFIFGHSMGSLLLRNFIFKYPENISGIVLSGTSYTPLFLIYLGKFIANVQVFFLGKKHKSKLLDKLSFGSFNKRFRPNRTAFDWLSSDKTEVEKYINDDYCGFLCTTRFFCDLFDGIKAIHNKANLLKTPSDLPVLIIAGTMDAVGDFKKGTSKVYHLLKKSGMKEITLKFYEGARHELTNETNKYKVFQDVVEWIQTKKASFSEASNKKKKQYS